MESLAQRATLPAVLNAFNSQGVANTAWAYATLRITHMPLINALAERAVHPEVVKSFTSQEVANTVWAYATLGVLNQVLMEVLAEKVLLPEVRFSFTAQTVANTAWAYATLGVVNLRLMEALADCALSPEVLPTYAAQEVANTVWAFAKLGMTHRRPVGCNGSRGRSTPRSSTCSAPRASPTRCGPTPASGSQPPPNADAGGAGAAARGARHLQHPEHRQHGVGVHHAGHRSPPIDGGAGPQVPILGHAGLLKSKLKPFRQTIDAPFLTASLRLNLFSLHLSSCSCPKGTLASDCSAAVCAPVCWTFWNAHPMFF
eukprot:TRINITY_DN5170_c0_g1_i1.p2 TRINITY_DN5170_c0_g1~~TRINITY_DN5170_c0_g1_i1.p2  ORF type:complete len:315 (+),score=18.23 TRINITY_DN5170_c0_g1_i1:383-1327(+)